MSFLYIEINSIMLMKLKNYLPKVMVNKIYKSYKQNVEYSIDYDFTMIFKQTIERLITRKRQFVSNKILKVKVVSHVSSAASL